MAGAFRPCRGLASTPECLDGPVLDLVSHGSDPFRQRLGSHRGDTLWRSVSIMQHRRRLSREIRPLLATDVRDRGTASAQVAQHRHERLRQDNVHKNLPLGGHPVMPQLARSVSMSGSGSRLARYLGLLVESVDDRDQDAHVSFNLGWGDGSPASAAAVACMRN